ncbi:MAG: hypothetical protein H6554_06245 [Chitinophagales bacterium]|nr:hypothetical protein [Chitinophagales bacterium]
MSGKERESIKSDIQYLTKRIIEKFELFKYDSGIAMESHNAESFIFYVENIIRKKKNKKEDK